MCNESMREAISKTADLEHLESLTFAQFAEFCYLGVLSVHAET